MLRSKCERCGLEIKTEKRRMHYEFGDEHEYYDFCEYCYKALLKWMGRMQ